MSVILEQNDTATLIHLEGAIDISCAAELKTALVEAFQRRTEVRVQLDVATDLDVTAIQLLWAAEREAIAKGAKLALTGPVPESLSVAVTNAGFERFPLAI